MSFWGIFGNQQSYFMGVSVVVISQFSTLTLLGLAELMTECGERKKQLLEIGLYYGEDEPLDRMLGNVTWWERNCCSFFSPSVKHQ